MPLKLMYITNRPDVAAIAEKNGVDRIFVDMEYIGKAARQGRMDTVQNHHTVEDVRKVRATISKAELLVRVNPIHDATDEYCSSEEEINAVIDAGADIVMLPYFKTIEEVHRFVNIVNGRVRTMLLLETKEAAAIRYDYLKAVKRLHPDINENLSESAKSLWNQIQQAYAENDWRQLKFLVGLVDDVMSGNAAVAASDGGLEEMRAACARLEAEAGDVAKNIADLKSKKPFTYEDLIDDSEALAQRQAWLNGRIKELESAIARYERIWNNGQ